MNTSIRASLERPEEVPTARARPTEEYSIGKLIFIALTLAFVVCSPTAEAANDSNTKLGRDAFKENATGTDGAALGYQVLRNKTTGSANTASKVNSVLYERINVMLLNEFLKEKKQLEEQQVTISELKKDLAVLTAQIKEQGAEIEKVSMQVQMRKPTQSLARNIP